MDLLTVMEISESSSYTGTCYVSVSCFKGESLVQGPVSTWFYSIQILLKMKKYAHLYEILRTQLSYFDVKQTKEIHLIKVQNKI